MVVQHTSWGHPESISDMRTLKKYAAFLRSIRLGLEALNFLLIVAVFLMFIFSLLHGVFEDAVIYDGTRTSCVLDGKTGEVTDVRR